MLKAYKRKKGLTDDQLASQIGISKGELRKIFEDNCPHLTFGVATKIKLATGLHVWQYLSGYEDIKELWEKKNNPRLYKRTIIEPKEPKIKKDL